MYLLDRSNMGHFRSGNNGQILQSFQASSAGRMNGSPVYLEQPDLWSRHVSLGGGRSAQGVPTRRRAVSDAGRRTGNGARARRHAGRHAVALGERQRARHGHSVGGALARRRCQPYTAAGNPARLRREQRDAGALEQPAERHARHARQLFEVQSAHRRERKSLRAEPVEQAGRLRLDWPVGRQRGAGRQRRRRSESRGPGPRSRSTGTATDDGNPIPPGQLTTTWSLASGPASVTFGAPNALSTIASFTVAGLYTIRLTAFDGEATTSDDVVVTVDPPAGSGTGLLAQYFNDAGSGIYFTALVLTRTDPTVDFDWADLRARSPGAGRQLLGSMERTGDGAGHRQLHVHHHV